MAYDWSALIDEITTVIGATWPEVIPNNGGSGIWELDEIARISWEEIETFRYAVWQTDAPEPGEWGLVNIAYEPLVTVHYLAPFPVGMATVREKLEALKSSLYGTPFSAGALLDVVRLDWTREHPANAVFLQKGVDYLAGSLTARFLVGESAL